jgi:hypothetical protein
MALPEPRRNPAWSPGALAGRARSVPASVVTQVDGLLDRVAARAVAAPLDVRTVEDAREQLQRGSVGASSAATWVAALAARTKKTLSFKGRAIPVSMAAKLGTEVVNSFRLGAYELEVLASLLVHRLRDAGLPVEPRAVQRAVVQVYVSPARDADTTRRPEITSASLAGLWLGRMMAVEPAVGRVTKAAESLMRLDRPALERLTRPR